jgi:hypothetical protein
MQAIRKFRVAALCAALGAVAAPALAQETETYNLPTGNSAYPPPVVYYTPTVREVYEAPPTTVYYVPSTTYYYAQPATTVVYEAPAIEVTAPYLTGDRRITADVVDTIAADPWISGRVGVETRDSNVNLSGIVTTPGQARRAERDAKSVPGVRNVENELRTRVGGAP